MLLKFKGMMMGQLNSKIIHVFLILFTILNTSCSYKNHEFNNFISDIENRQKYFFLLRTDEIKLQNLLETLIYGDLIILSYTLIDKNDYFNKNIWIDRMCNSINSSIELDNKGIINLQDLLDTNSDDYDKYIKAIKFCNQRNKGSDEFKGSVPLKR